MKVATMLYCYSQQIGMFCYYCNNCLALREFPCYDAKEMLHMFSMPTTYSTSDLCMLLKKIE
jgi:hypothetical protein